jgi:hypothetical protein
VSPTELTQAWEVEDVTALASTHEDAKGLVQNVALHEGELTVACQDQEVAEEKFCSLSDALANGAQWLAVFEMEHQE